MSIGYEQAGEQCFARHHMKGNFRRFLAVLHLIPKSVYLLIARELWNVQEILLKEPDNKTIQFDSIFPAMI